MLSKRILALALPMFLAAALSASEKKDGGDDIAEPPPAAEASAPREFARKDALIEAGELARLVALAGEKLVIIDARDEEAYQQGHIPGAFNVQADLLQSSEAPYYLASAATVKKLCLESGINAGSRVVVYDEDDGRLAARVWFTLHAYGHRNVAILNGGLSLWKAGSHSLSASAPAKSKPGAFAPAEILRGLCSFAELPQFRVRVHTPGLPPTTTLIDARSLREYMGEDLRGKFGGHIPGAANLEWSAFMSGQEHARVWRSPPEIYALLNSAGVDPKQKIAVYDQAGGRSAHCYFTLWLMGYDNIFNYTAGWREYGNREDVEAEK